VTLTRKTLAMWAVALVLGLALLLPQRQVVYGEDLPSLPGVDRDLVTRIEITAGVRERIAIEGSMETGWKMLQPFEAEVDRILIRSLLNLYVDPVPMDTRVDSGDRETYGLDQSNRVLVELFTEGEVPALSVNVGADLPGGVSFVRLPEDEGIYRAKVGGRRRVDKAAKDWVNRFIYEEDLERITALELRTPSEDLVFVREPSGEVGMDGVPVLGPWSLVDAPAFDLDQRSVESAVRSLSKFRAGEILSSEFEGGWLEPAAVVTLRTVDGVATTFTFGSRILDGAAFVRRDDEPEVYRISATYHQGVTRDREAFTSLQLFDFVQDDVARMRLDDGGVPVVVVHKESGSWEITEPPNVFTDVKRVFFAVNTLGDLRARAWIGLSAAEAGLEPPSMTIAVSMHDGDREVLELGDRIGGGRSPVLWYGRIEGSERIFTVGAQTVSRVRQGFGRAD